MSPDKTTAARRMYAQQELTVAQIGKVLGVSRSSVYRALRRAGDLHPHAGPSTQAGQPGHPAAEHADNGGETP